MAQYKSQGYSMVNLNFRVTGEHARLVHEAAELRQESAAGFMRRIVLEWAAAELKLPAPDLSEYTGDIIATAAKRMGLTPKAFVDQAARESAARVLHAEPRAEVVGRLSTELQARLAEAPPQASTHQSGERRAAGRGRNR